MAGNKVDWDFDEDESEASQLQSSSAGIRPMEPSGVEAEGCDGNPDPSSPENTSRTSTSRLDDRGHDLLRRALGLSENDSPFPWQLELLRRFLTGETVRALDIPTGLGKTATMAIWLVARALGASLPRR